MVSPSHCPSLFITCSLSYIVLDPKCDIQVKTQIHHPHQFHDVPNIGVMIKLKSSGNIVDNLYVLSSLLLLPIQVKTIFVPTGASLTVETCAPLVATLPLEIKWKIEEFIKVVFALSQDLDFTFLEMNPFALVEGKPYPLDMRGELDDTAAFKNFKKWGNIEFPMPFGRVMSATESFIHGLDEKTSASLKFTVLNPKGRIWTMVAGGGASVIYADTVGDLGFASELGNYAEYSGAPNEEEVLQYARVVLDCATADPDGRKRALVIGGGIANFTDVAATFNGIIRALKEKEANLKAARMHIYVRRGGPNYQKGLAKMRSLGEEIGIPIEVYGPEATMTGICKEAIHCITAAA